MQIQFDYAKWLVATLVAAHSAALYFVATHVPAFPRSFCTPYVFGLVLTLISGLLSWTNAAVYVNLMESWTDPFMLSDDTRWPKESSSHKFWVTTTTFATLASGVLSGICLVWGAISFEAR